MSAELHAGGAGSPLAMVEPRPGDPSLDDARPNVSGDLPTLFQAAPMFRRTVAGYDRFQVDTYVRWAEDELATASREREHLMAAHLRTRAALDEANELLTHSAGGGELLQASRRIGSMLATAADEAADMHAEAQAARTAAEAEAERLVASADEMVAEARAEAEGLLARAVSDAGEVTAEAGRVLEQAEHTAAEARAEATTRLDEVRAMEMRAVTAADRIREGAEREAAAARLRARSEIVAMLTTAREERRRADAEAAGAREQQDAAAAARRAFLQSEIEDLEQRRAVLLAELSLARAVGAAPSDEMGLGLRRRLERIRTHVQSGTRSRRFAPRPSGAANVPAARLPRA
jgi:hypothetical protein